MARIFLLILLIFSVSVYGYSGEKMFSSAVALEKSLTKSNQFKAYNKYKNIYLQALMDDNEPLRIKALKGIVRTGNRLKIDISRYSKELKKATKSKVSKKLVKKRVSNKSVSYNSLRYARWRNSKLELVFSKPLKSNQLNFFHTHNKKYMYIFDIHSSMSRRSKILKKYGIDKIKIFRLDRKVIRLVIENKKPLDVRFSKKAFGIEVSISKHNLKKTNKVYNKTDTIKLDRNKIIVIDAGHGGKDPGAIGYRHRQEKDVVLGIAKKLRDILEARGYRVYMTRSSDVFVKLRNRTKFANEYNADLFISIHANAVSKEQAYDTYGIESYFLSKSRSERAKNVAAVENSADLADMNFYGKESFLNTLNYHNIIAANKLAIDLQRSALASLKKRYSNVKDAGVREGPFWVLVGAQMPAVLVEVGFITNPMESKRLESQNYQRTLAEGLANGVDRYLFNCRKRSFF